MVCAALSFVTIGAAQEAALPTEYPTIKVPEMPARRDPFWPVGWKPTLEAAQAGANQVASDAVAWPKLVHKGNIRHPKTGKYLANIEGFGVVEEGQLISRKEGGYLFKWRVAAIDAKTISLEKLTVEKQ